MSTLPPEKPYDPNVPVVTSAGGTKAAYKDPNSPESMMRKTAALNAQSQVDSKYDNATPAYETSGSDVKEGFCDACYRWVVYSRWIHFVVFLIALFGLALMLGKLKGSALYALILLTGFLVFAKVHAERYVKL